MALVKKPLSTRVQIRLSLGLGENGRERTRAKSLNNIKTDAPDQDIFDVASALAALQSYPVAGIRKVEQSDLING
ncbi:DUF1659 domain-containing protein [Eubacteriales bacterium mix99]